MPMSRPDLPHLIDEQDLCQSEVANAEKACHLMESINNINKITTRLMNLIFRITREAEPDSVECKSSVSNPDNTSLFVVLSHGHAMIDEEVKECFKKIDNIENLLF